MANIRTSYPEPDGKIAITPVARFVTDFRRLITDVDRLMTDIGSLNHYQVHHHRPESQRHMETLDESIASLQDHARSFVKSVNRTLRAPAQTSTSEHELLLKLSRAHSFISVVQIVAGYCRRVVASPAGMIFMQRGGKLRVVSQWRSNQAPRRYFSEEEIRNGRVSHTFRTGLPVFGSQTKSGSEIAQYFRSLLPGQRWRSAAFLPINSPGGRPSGVVALFFLHEHDWSKERRDELSRLGQLVSGALIRAHVFDDALAASAAAEGIRQRHEGYLSMVCHELKNPMTPILNWAVALSSGTLPPEKQSIAVESIIRNVRAMNYLIDDLFDLARISAGKLRLELAEMRIQDVVRESLTATQQTAERKKLRITTDISEAIPPFLADSRRLRQVLINLVTNAVKFTPAQGSISLRVARRGDYMECTVSDTGQGIEPEFLPLVFDRFQQENRSLKNKGAGLGLGLAIVREIVELHGGSVRAQSRGAHRGATFSFRLPMRRKAGS